MKHEHRALITWPGLFPFDMLRYDRCYPDRETDSSRMEMAARNRQRGVAVVVTHREAGFTVDRWESFGARCEPLTNEQAIEWHNARRWEAERSA